MAKNKYTDLDNGASDKWKKKYLNNLEELEKKRKSGVKVRKTYVH